MTPIRERDISVVQSFPGSFAKKGSGDWKQDAKPSSFTYKGRQKTVSSGHPKNPKTGKYDSGGPFFTYRIVPEHMPGHVNLDVTDSPWRYKYNGPITIPILTSDYSGFAAPSESDKHMDKYGAEAISIIDPTNSNAATGVALGEIIKDKRISLPGISAWKNRTDVARAAGSEYLSAQFGWLPLVKDVRDTSQSIRDGNRIIENYQSSSGSLVHREFAFDDIESYSERLLSSTPLRCSYGATSIGAFNQGTPQLVSISTKSTTKRWFSGSFTYASSQASSLGKCLGVESEIDKLFGLTLTPDVLWELTPWSWALDWFSNAGNVISNATSFGLAGLVMKYGYIMEETTIVETYSMPSSGLTGNTAAASAKVTCVTKRRKEANPFGFGVGWEGLSPTQLAITAALGITRLR